MPMRHGHHAPLPLLATATAALLLSLAACAARQSSSPNRPVPPDVQLAAAWISGSFSNAAQAAADPVNFRHVLLEAAPIWTDSPPDPRAEPALWFYIEQAEAQNPDAPYRQRVYRFVGLRDGSVRSDVYEFAADPLKHAGAWKKPSPLADLSVKDLVLREGCSVTMRLTDGAGPRAFIGSTSGTGCASRLRGAAYATSEVRLSEDQIVSWDRGFDRDGLQVWGAVSGGYIFNRTAPR